MFLLIAIWMSGLEEKKRRKIKLHIQYILLKYKLERRHYTGRKGSL